MSDVDLPRYVSIADFIPVRHVERSVPSADSPTSEQYALNPVVGCPSVDATSTISILTAHVVMV